ncbi:MAG: hypothetical protein HOP19_19105 [Acidobacteria bacterium]|nr:hypothetical protein [Acidobacteriota bacterium]
MKNNFDYRFPSHFTRKAGEKILFAFFALLSLGYAAYSTFHLVSAHAAASYQPIAPALTVAADDSAAAAPTGAADVVTKALAFKALLTTTQQATLEQTYTTTLARNGRICRAVPTVAMPSSSAR